MNEEQLIDDLFQKASNITKSELIDFFAVTGSNSKAKLPANTKIMLTKELLNKNNSIILGCTNLNEILNTETTAGRILVWSFIFNTIISFQNRQDQLVEGMLYQKMPFINKAYSAGIVGTYDGLLADMYIDNLVGSNTLETYINKMQWLGYTSAIFTLPSLDLKTLNPPKEIKDLQNKLIKDNKAAIESKDVVTFAKIEKTVLDAASDALTKNGATGKMIYDSGFNGSWSNNYKVTSIFRGVVPKSDNNTEFNIATSNLKDGVSKVDLVTHADIAVAGAAGRAKDTQKGGYLTKIFNSAFGSIQADEEGTDCGSDVTLNIELTKDNFRQYRFRFIIDGNQYVMLDSSNKDKYIGKTVKMRTPTACRTQKKCHRCLGDMFYRLKVRNIGLHSARVSATLMNLSMKSFHNMSVSPKEYNLLDYIKESK